MSANPQDTADLVTFTEEILNGKLHFFEQCKSRTDRVLPGSKVRGDWQQFLNKEENKQELFIFLPDEYITIEFQCNIITIIRDSVITNGSYEMSFIAR